MNTYFLNFQINYLIEFLNGFEVGNSTMYYWDFVSEYQSFIKYYKGEKFLIDNDTFLALLKTVPGLKVEKERDSLVINVSIFN